MRTHMCTRVCVRVSFAQLPSTLVFWIKVCHGLQLTSYGSWLASKPQLSLHLVLGLPVYAAVAGTLQTKLST